MTAILEARNLKKSFPAEGEQRLAVAGVDLTIAAGEFVAIMGPSGCGKSTLLHMAGGLDRPTEGEVWLAGKRVDQLSEAAWARLRRRSIGYVFQFFNLIGNLSAAENIEMPALVAGLSAGEARTRRRELMAALGIESRAGLVPARLSGGERQRVALARALINRPAVLLADEPTGSLDSTATQEVLGLLRQYHEAGQTILLVTHDPRVAAATERVVRMRDGRVVSETRMDDNTPIRALTDLIAIGE